MGFLTIVIISCFVISASGAPNARGSRIVNGNPTVRGEFPFVAELKLNGYFRCGAFIYNQNYAVTSAICVYGYSAANFEVVAGQWDRNVTEQGEEVRSVTNIKIHEMYQPSNYKNNIALVRLSSPLSLGTLVDSAAVGAEQRPGEATLIGWGNAGSGAAQTQLKKATIVLDPSDNCNSYGSLFDSNLMLCAGKGFDACQGDAGSPLFQLNNVITSPPTDTTTNAETTIATTMSTDNGDTTTATEEMTETSTDIVESSTVTDPASVNAHLSTTGVVIGIVSHNEACDSPVYPTIYTKLSAFSSWLLSNAGPQF